MHIVQTISPKRCASMRITFTKPAMKFGAFSTKKLTCIKSYNKTLISSLQQWELSFIKLYLDGLCRLAFNLMGYGGGLVHLGTATQNSPLYPSESQEARREAKRATSTLFHSAVLCLGRSVFSVFARWWWWW